MGRTDCLEKSRRPPPRRNPRVLCHHLDQQGNLFCRLQLYTKLKVIVVLLFLGVGQQRVTRYSSIAIVNASACASILQLRWGSAEKWNGTLEKCPNRILGSRMRAMANPLRK